MIKILVIALIALIIFVALVGMIFKHEVKTWVYKFNRKDELKDLEHKLKRLEIDSNFYNSTIGHELEREQVQSEILETRKMIDKIRNGEKI